MAKSQLSINPRGVWSEMKLLEVWLMGGVPARHIELWVPSAVPQKLSIVAHRIISVLGEVM